MKVWEFQKNDYLKNLFDENMNNWKACVKNNFSDLVDKRLPFYCQF